jgi:hypothetical protein
VVLGNDYTGPGAGLSDRPAATAAGSSNSDSSNKTAPPPSPILTAGSEHPECVN